MKPSEVICRHLSLVLWGKLPEKKDEDFESSILPLETSLSSLDGIIIGVGSGGKTGMWVGSALGAE